MIFAPLMPWTLVLILAILTVIAMLFAIFYKPLRRLSNFRLLGIIACVLVIIARPMILGGNNQRMATDLNIYFALDTTGSMAVQDSAIAEKSNSDFEITTSINGRARRLESAKVDILNIARKFSGASYSVFGLSAQPFRALPLISDVETLKTTLSTLYYPETRRSAGTSLNEFVNFIAENISKNLEAMPERKSLLIILSDGEDTKGVSAQLQSKVDSERLKTYVIGYGTTTGGTVPTFEICTTEYSGCSVGDMTYGEPVGEGWDKTHISKLDEVNLAKMAASFDGEYIGREKVSDVPNGISDDDVLTFAPSDDLIQSSTDLYWIFAIIAIILLCWTLSDSCYKLLTERKAN